MLFRVSIDVIAEYFEFELEFELEFEFEFGFGLGSSIFLFRCGTDELNTLFASFVSSSDGVQLTNALLLVKSSFSSWLEMWLVCLVLVLFRKLKSRLDLCF